MLCTTASEQTHAHVFAATDLRLRREIVNDDGEIEIVVEQLAPNAKGKNAVLPSSSDTGALISFIGLVVLIACYCHCNYCYASCCLFDILLVYTTTTTL
jgi:hypothetical protein